MNGNSTGKLSDKNAATVFVMGILPIIAAAATLMATGNVFLSAFAGIGYGGWMYERS